MGGRSERRCGRGRRAASAFASGKPLPRAPWSSMRGRSRARRVTGAKYASPVVEARTRHEVESDRARVRVRRAVRDEHERRSARALDLDLLVEARVALSERFERDPHERDVAGPPPVGAPPELVDLPDELGVEAEPGVEAEAASVHASRARCAASGLPRPAAQPAPGCVAGRARAGGRSSRRRAGTRAARRATTPVQHLVVRAVAAEDVDRVDSARRHARSRSPRPARA